MRTGAWSDAASQLSPRPAIFIDDTGGATVLEMRAKSRRLHAQLLHETRRAPSTKGESSVEPHGLDLVIVDYLQLAHGDGRTDSREQEISQISRGLKGLREGARTFRWWPSRS